jgi:hypothetical protein
MLGFILGIGLMIFVAYKLWIGILPWMILYLVVKIALNPLR